MRHSYCLSVQDVVAKCQQYYMIGRIVVVNESDSVQSEPLSVGNVDRTTRFLIGAIFAVIVLILTGVVFVLVQGTFTNRVPRTANEAQVVIIGQAVKDTPHSVRAWTDYIRALTAVGRYDEAHEAVMAARKALKSAELLAVNVEAVNLLNAQGKYTEALTQADSNMEFETKERARVAKEKADAGLTMDARLYGSELGIKSALSRANAATGLKKWDIVIESLTDALQYDQTAADLLTVRGMAYLESGDKAKAEADFKNARRYDPETADATSGRTKAGE